MSLALSDVVAAAGRIAGSVLRTPTVPSAVLSRLTGAEIVLKLDNLQAVGSFKERGAANRLALLTADERRRGVVAMSAGNHAQGVARHASLHGVASTIVMPLFTPLAKVSGTAAWGAKVVLFGETLVEAAAHAAHLAEHDGLVFISPYDDYAVMAGQGTLALEMFEDGPELDVLLVPIGGGVDRLCVARRYGGEVEEAETHWRLLFGVVTGAGAPTRKRWRPAGSSRCRLRRSRRRPHA